MLPFCPFVRGHGAKHSAQYLDLGPRDLREHFELPATAESAYVCSPRRQPDRRYTHKTAAKMTVLRSRGDWI